MLKFLAIVSCQKHFLLIANTVNLSACKNSVITCPQYIFLIKLSLEISKRLRNIFLDFRMVKEVQAVKINIIDRTFKSKIK